MARRLFLLFIVAAFALAPLPEFTGWGAGLAVAQQKRQTERRPSLFDLLFGGALRRQQERQKERVQKKQAKRVQVKREGSNAPSAQAAPQKVEKAENALKVVVAGDFMAGGLSEGLIQSYASNPNVVFIDASSGLSGLVRDDVVNWAVRVPELIEEHKPAAVVFLAGMNDRQQMRVDGQREQKLSEPWKAEYDRRIAAIAESAKASQTPLIWVGLPPVKSGAMNTDYLVFNARYRVKSELANGKFVDVWDGFTNAEGVFISAGPDINGQIVRLRNSDGINMTSAGKAKLAFYAERELRKLPGLANDAVLASIEGDAGPQTVPTPEYDPASSGRTIVIALDSPQADGGDTLEGAGEFLTDTAAEQSTAYALVTKGEFPSTREGRIDSAWEKPKPVEAQSITEKKNEGAAVKPGSGAAEGQRSTN